MKTYSLFRCAAVTLIIVACVWYCAPCRAQDMGEKFKRGVVNTACGILEVPGCVTDMTEKNGPLMGYTVGFFKGVGMIPVRTLLGVYDLLTFYVPAPKDYQPVIKPDTPFNYFVDWRPQSPTPPEAQPLR